jgi:hypothetical protein
MHGENWDAWPELAVIMHDSASGGDARSLPATRQAACRYQMCEAVDMTVPGGGLHDRHRAGA